MESECSRKEEKQTCQNLIEHAQEKAEKKKVKDCGKKKEENQCMIDNQKEYENEKNKNKNESNKREYAGKMVDEQLIENCETLVGERELIEQSRGQYSREQGHNKTKENDLYELTKEMHKRKAIQAKTETLQTKSTNEDENEHKKINDTSGCSNYVKIKYMIGPQLGVIAQQEQERKQKLLGRILSKYDQQFEEQIKGKGLYGDDFYTPFEKEGKDKKDTYTVSLKSLSSLFNVRAGIRRRSPHSRYLGNPAREVFYETSLFDEDMPGFENNQDDLQVFADINDLIPPPAPQDHLDDDPVNPEVDINQQYPMNLVIGLPVLEVSEFENDDEADPQHSNPSTPPPDLLE